MKVDRVAELAGPEADGEHTEIFQGVVSVVLVILGILDLSERVVKVRVFDVDTDDVVASDVRARGKRDQRQHTGEESEQAEPTVHFVPIMTSGA